MNRRESLALLLHSGLGAALLPQKLWASKPLETTQEDHIQFFEAFSSQLLGTFYQGNSAQSTYGIAAACFIQNCLTKEAQEDLSKGCITLQQHCKKTFNTSFEAASQEQQKAVMNRLFDTKQPLFADAFSFAKSVRSVVLFNFFNSEYGATQVLEYLPIPGGYQGQIARDKNSRIWTH